MRALPLSLLVATTLLGTNSLRAQGQPRIGHQFVPMRLQGLNAAPTPVVRNLLPADGTSNGGMHGAVVGGIAGGVLMAGIAYGLCTGDSGHEPCGGKTLLGFAFGAAIGATLGGILGSS